MSTPDPTNPERPASTGRDDAPLSHRGADPAWRLRLNRLWRGCMSRWPWLVAATAVCAAAGFLAGYASGSYVVRVELLATSFSAAVSSGRSGSTVDAAAVDSLVQLFRSETALRRVARASRPSLTPEAIASASEVRRIPDSGLVRIQVQGTDLQGAVDLANTYGSEASAAAREIWLSQCQELNREVVQRLASVDEQLAQTSREWGDFQRRTLGTDFSGDEGSALRRLTELDRKTEGLRSQIAEGESVMQNLNREIARLSPALTAARDALAQALTRYTEEHPKVKELRAVLESFEAQCLPQTGSAQSSMLVLSSPAAVSLYTRLMELKSQQTSLSRDLETTEQLRKDLRAQMADLPGHQAAYVRLKSQLEALRDQRFLLARRQQEVRLAEADSGGVRIIASSSREGVSRSPKIRSGLATGAWPGSEVCSWPGCGPPSSRRRPGAFARRAISRKPRACRPSQASAT